MTEHQVAPDPGPDGAPPRVVLDTCVVLDWLVFREPAVQPLGAAIECGRLQWVASGRTLAELGHVLQRAPIAARGVPADAVLQRVAAAAYRVDDPPPALVPRLRCSDPEDQKFIELALSAGARWLLSHDRAVLKLARRAGHLGLLVCAPHARRGEGPVSRPWLVAGADPVAGLADAAHAPSA